MTSLPLGLDTAVGEHGSSLSGGQRQRLALARALLADFPILVLDEPGEHLDAETADALTRDLLSATTGRTTLLITHRLAALESVDEIVVLDEGHIVERTDAPNDINAPDERCRMNVGLARLQFATTTIYHFLFVPVTIGLGFLVAVLQTMWYRGGDPEYKRLTKFFGTLLRHQRRDRRRHRARAGVRVRHELVELLALCRRCVRRPARDGGLGCVLPRVDVPRPLALRMGSTVEARASHDDLACRHRGRCSPPRSSSLRTRGCSTRSAMRSTRRRTGRC